MEKQADSTIGIGGSVSKPKTEAYKATQYFLRRVTPPSLYYRFRTFTREYPLLFLPFSRWRWDRWRKQYCIDTSGPEPAAPEPVTKDTEIVIEGFPRMGNTFAHIAFKMAQDRVVKIGHHTHAAAQVIAAVKMGIPAIVIIREPEQAIISYLIGNFDPGLTVGQSLREYISFYKTIKPYKDRCIVASFEDITSDYGKIIQKANDQFNTDFVLFEHTEENVNSCFKLIDEGYQEAFGTLSEKVVSRPSESRENLKSSFQKEFQSQKYLKLRRKAYSIYKEVKDTE
jgi:hypothetical protein